MGVAAAGMALQSTAKSYAQILGSNERVNFAVIGLHSRAYAHLAALKANAQNARIVAVCDVQSDFLQKYAGAVQRSLGNQPATGKDFRKVLESKEIDAITIAAPDHWHMPMAMDGLKADKHVYVEKPCSHNPAEGALLVRAQQKYGKLVQMGTQQRSSPHTIEIVGRIHAGLIGRAYMAKAWYCNTRKSIGFGKDAPVPAVLDWDLFQGPAPRRPYKDNIQPYNWHWFRIYGTGEALNNGTHEVDVCRWALDVDLPNRVTASGGRYAFKDDWQYYDTLVTNFEYENKLISWESASCSGMKTYNRDRGSVILGTTGSVLVDRDGYEVYDLSGRKTDEFRVGSTTSSADLVGADSMTSAHFANFIAGIRTGQKLNAPVAVGNVTVTMLQLSNIAWTVQHELKLDPSDGHVLDDSGAMKLWSREYEKGWEPRI
jgi:predicted dehydrogenase